MSLRGESHGQRSLAGYSPGGHKESDTSETHTHTHTHAKQEEREKPVGGRRESLPTPSLSPLTVTGMVPILSIS